MTSFPQDSIESHDLRIIEAHVTSSEHVTSALIDSKIHTISSFVFLERNISVIFQTLHWKMGKIILFLVCLISKYYHTSN